LRRVSDIDLAVIMAERLEHVSCGTINVKLRRGTAVANVAIARKLAVRLYWKLRKLSSPASPARMQGSRNISW
jgi:hypothetical protein